MKENKRAAGEGPRNQQPSANSSVGSEGKGVTWESEPDPDPWHADSSLPASESLSEIGSSGEEIAEPEPVDDEDDVLSEAVTVIPGAAAPVSSSVASESADPLAKGRQRSQTIARKQMLRERRRLIAQGGLPEVLDYERPEHRSDCREGRRPCLYVACRYHLFLDVNPVTGSIKINFPETEIWQLEETCALDVAERGGVTLEEVGDIMNLTRERIRQVEASGLDKLRTGEASLSAFLDGSDLVVGGPGTTGHHRLPVLDD